ncbi:MAG: hypothetical protein ABH951_01685 [Patescibacteria group bacterium]
MSKLKFKNKRGGFLKLILIIIVVVFLLSYFHVTISGVFNWIVHAFQSVFT